MSKVRARTGTFEGVGQEKIGVVEVWHYLAFTSDDYFGLPGLENVLVDRDEASEVYLDSHEHLLVEHPDYPVQLGWGLRSVFHSVEYAHSPLYEGRQVVQIVVLQWEDSHIVRIILFVPVTIGDHLNKVLDVFMPNIVVVVKNQHEVSELLRYDLLEFFVLEIVVLLGYQPASLRH